MKQYYYLNAQGQQMPPVDYDTLSKVGITADTMVWTEGMANWTRAGDVPELRPMLACVPPQYGQMPPQATVSQPPYQPGNVMQKPDSWLWLGIVTTLLCCLPAGIVSIVYAAKVDSLWNRGAYNEAYEASNKAKTWGFISLGVGIFVSAIYFFAVVLS